MPKGSRHSQGSDIQCAPASFTAWKTKAGAQGLPPPSTPLTCLRLLFTAVLPPLSKALMFILLSFHLHIKILGEKSQDIRKIHSGPNAALTFSPHWKLSLASVVLLAWSGQSWRQYPEGRCDTEKTVPRRNLSSESLLGCHGWLLQNPTKPRGHAGL